MPVGVCIQRIEGLEVLEKGLKSLRRSRMMTLRDFKDMYGAIERHHRDLKLAHLTGKSQDLMDQAERDTKFYHILVQMLCEVKEVKVGKQEESLRKVYTWYLANKHVLYSGPHFGKIYQKEAAKQMIKKATTPRNPPPSREQQPHSRKDNTSTGKDSAKSNKRSNLSNGHSSPKSILKQPRDEDGMPRTPRTDCVPSSHGGDFSDSELDLELPKTPVNEYDGLDESAMARINSQMDSASFVFGSETPSVRITPVRERSTSTPPHTHAGLPRRMIHSVSSMVNPHAQPSLTLSPEHNKHESSWSYRPTTAPLMREDILQSWKNYNSGVKYGQDVISKLDFVGRSGTLCDVRYTAHERGEMPELNTKQFLQGVQALQNGNEENKLLKQTLEEFYQTTDAYYPTNLPKYRSSRLRNKQDTVQASPAPPQPQSQPQPSRNSIQQQQIDSEPCESVQCDVKLDTVVSLIDSVTDNMAASKERVVPRPQLGFRQPSAAGIPSTPAVSRPTTSLSGKQSSRQASPTARSNTPVYQAADSRVGSAPGMSEGETEPRTPSALQSRSASAVDWRGKITPDSVRYRWGKTKFGAHTYVKNLKRPKSMRSAGSASASHRPMTAPHSFRRQQNKDKVSDAEGKRVPQAASHGTGSVEQEDLDNIMVIKHLLGSSDSRRGSFGSLFDFDEDFFKHISMHSTSGPVPSTSPALEYLSFITSSRNGHHRDRVAATVCSRRRGQGTGSLVTDTDIGTLSDQFLSSTQGLTNPSQSSFGEINQVLVSRSVESVSSGADHGEFDTQLSDLCEEGHQGEVTDVHTGNEIPQDECKAPDLELNARFNEEDSEDIQVKVTTVPAVGSGPVPAQHRPAALQVLTKSNTWSYIPEVESASDHTNLRDQLRLDLQRTSSKFQVTSEHFTGVDFQSETQPDLSYRMSTRVERSAGRMPGQTTSGQALRTSRRQTDVFKKTVPVRTPPSIPTPYNPYGGRSPRGRPVFHKELENHARKEKSPRHFMEHDSREVLSSRTQHVHDLRQAGPPKSASPVLSKTNSDLSESLSVCRLPTREKTINIVTDNEFDRPPSILKDSEPSYSRDMSDVDKQVKFGATSEVSVDEGLPDEIRDPRPKLQSSKTDSGQSSKRSSEPSTPQTKQSLARIGRPIAHYHHVPDPDEVAKAVQTQKEAKAAVDIQRLFRGYVARGMYRKLLTDERHRFEDAQREKLESRRKHNEHVERTQAIYNRGQNPEDVAWQQDYQSLKEQKGMERQIKMNKLSKENAYNQHVSNATISVIGPHVEIYQVYHPKKTGPSQREFNQYALKIQKTVRGWLVRRRLHKLRRKSTWTGFSFERIVRDYKTMLARVQRQHGCDRPKTPFTFKEMNEYMDLRRRYESVFEKKAFGGELELNELDQFFKECDLYPSQSELDESVDVVFKGKGLKGRGLRKKEVLDIVFYVYVPSAAGLEGTRKSTWMSPIIDGVEARRLIGTEFVEPAPLDVCAKLVINSKRERRERENRARREAREQDGDSSDSSEDEKEKVRKMKEKLRERLAAAASVDEH